MNERLMLAVCVKRGEGGRGADVGFSKKCMGSGMSYRDTSAISKEAFFDGAAAYVIQRT